MFELVIDTIIVTVLSLRPLPLNSRVLLVYVVVICACLFILEAYCVSTGVQLNDILSVSLSHIIFIFVYMLSYLLQSYKPTEGWVISQVNTMYIICTDVSL